MAARLKLTKSGKGWRGTCPACGYSGAFTLTLGTNGRPIYWCSCCQDKAGIAAAVRGVGAGEQCAGTKFVPGKDEAALERRLKAFEAARVVWSGAAPVTPDDPAAKYLTRRGLAHLIGCLTLRYRDDVPHPAGGRAMGLVALVQSVDGKPLGIHRTYLQPDGTKTCLIPPKASLGPIWGGGIRLAAAAPKIIVGEGIESAASAGLLLGLPAWAAISAGNLGKGLVLPPDVRSVVIGADDDGVSKQGRNPGIEAAEAAAARWLDEGRMVRIIKPSVTGKDFNDVLQDRTAGKVAP